MRKICLFACLLLQVVVVYSTIVTYPRPDETIDASRYYQVQVSDNQKHFPSFVYYSQATFKDTCRSSSWTSFSFDGKIEIKIDLPAGGEVHSCEIKPKIKNIQATIEGSSIRFYLSEPARLAVVVNNDAQNPLFIFANPLEESPQTSRADDVMYFGPGVHDVGVLEIPAEIREVYLAGGAYVKGAIKSGLKHDGLIIRGRGILSSEIFPKIYNNQRNIVPDWKDLNPHNIYLGDASGTDILVEGITLIDGPMYALIVRQKNSVVRNVKCMGWYYNTDGVSMGDNGLIEDCFFRCNDDAVKVYNTGAVIRRCVFWQNDNGAPFQISWNLRSDNHSFHVYDCDVVYCEHSQDANNRAIFNAIHGGEGRLSDYLFENIRIEGDVFRLFKLTIQTSPSDGDEGFGSLSGLVFRNIDLEGQCFYPNEIWGHDSSHGIFDVTFENLTINGKEILNADDGNFRIDPETTRNIQFK